MYDIVQEIWKNPGAQYSPYPVWSWKENDTADELVAHLDSFHRKGIDAVIVEMPDCGLTDNLVELFPAVLEAAKKRFMLVMICDSFFAGKNAIIDEEKRAAERVLMLKPTSERSADDEAIFSVYVKRDGELLDDVKIGCGDGYEQFDLVLGYGNTTEVDMLNPYSAEKLIGNVLEKYKTVISGYLGSTVVGFYVRPVKHNGLLWSYGLEEEWMTLGGDIPSLVSLLIEPKVKKLRREAEFIYNKMLHAKLTSAYLEPVSKWCREHGIGLCGSINGDVADVVLASNFDVPASLFGHDNGDDIRMKAISDTARHRGIAHAAAEVNCGFTAVSPDKLMCEINRAITFGSSMVIQDDFSSDIPDNSPVWCEYKKVASYIKRMTWLNSTGTNEPSCAVLCSSDYIPDVPVKKLYSLGYTFNYLTIDDLMNKAHVHDGEIHIDRYAYKALLVDTRLRLSTEIVEKIGRFVTQDGLMYRGTDFASFAEKHLTKGIRFVSDKNGDDITFLHMTKSGCPFCVMINHSDSVVSGKLITSDNYSANRFDAFNGKTTPEYAEMTDNGFEYAISIAEHSSVVIGFDPDSLVRLKNEEEQTLTLAEIKSLPVWDSMLFDVREDTKKVVIVAEDINGVTAVKINGENAGRFIFRPYSIDVSKLVNIGENKVELELCGAEVEHDKKLCSGLKAMLYRD